MNTAQTISPLPIPRVSSSDFHSAWKAVAEIELDSILSSLHARHDIDESIRHIMIDKYRKWLVLAKLYRGLPLPPTKEIDEMWHEHIIHTKKYFSDCKYLFGEYLHHNPANNPKDPNYAGVCREDSIQTTMLLWKEHYNEDIDYSAGFDCCT